MDQVVVLSLYVKKMSSQFALNIFGGSWMHLICFIYQKNCGLQKNWADSAGNSSTLYMICFQNTPGKLQTPFLAKI